MKLIILGDIHGQWKAANASVHAALKEHPDAKAVIQLGDLGDGWPMPDGTLNRWPIDFDLPVFVVDGNHENFDAIEAGDVNPKLTWMPRGSVKKFGRISTMFFGGATSPDFYGRLIGRSWWPQESITWPQIKAAMELETPNPLTAMFCHERADIFAVPKHWRLPPLPGNPGLSDRRGLSMVAAKHQPMFYFHGHWHNSDQCGFMIEGWACCVVACPVIESKPKWTVFDGTQIWKNW